ncbi:prolactin receptor-like isoform X2 [Melanotaenia boesemani]|uniref:prolactin receptor-like isoform X2 n=1 Tax=Melanotaenia boesemani TaxID=1250792 RepID=UPI001C049B3D|nr:prolactin receptor-like isoform X2 [Melanotaenia boesemani]
MLWPLLCLLPLVGSSRIVAQEVGLKARHVHEEAVAVTTRPHIYYCRSPNMEDFTCWWNPLDNLTGDEVTYVLTYSKDKGPKHECPDYVTGGPNSCHFDSSHTSIWTIYCMNVTAITAHRNHSSQEHCLDVAEIVETEAPVNLTYKLTDPGGDEMGHNALLSWKYPAPEHLLYGWITLEYELQYRRVTEPDNWKVKHPLREVRVELLGLRVGDYVVRVRCRSHNYGLWSKWSSTLLMSIPGKPPTGKVLVLILVAGVGVVALLAITFGVIPHSKRIKDYFLPPIPKPRILGIDPLLLKKGNFEEINRHFSNFHSYRPPSYSEEVWDHLTSDDIYLTTPKDYSIPADVTDGERGALKVSGHLKPVAAQHPFPAPNPASYVQSVPPYCSLPPEVFTPLLDAPTPWLRPEIVVVPGTDYSMMEHPGHASAIPPPDSTHFTASHSPQDFYTCVHLMNESGEVHLVPCLPPAYCREFPPFRSVASSEEEEEKKKLAEYQAWKSTMKDGGVSERSEAGVPLLPVSVDNTG